MKNILVAVTGEIATYKVANVISGLKAHTFFLQK